MAGLETVSPVASLGGNGISSMSELLVETHAGGQLPVIRVVLESPQGMKHKQCEGEPMSIRAEGVRVAQPLFQAVGGGSTPTSALQLFFRRVDFGTSKALVAAWHSRLPVLASRMCRLSYVAEFDGLFFAAAVWSRPVARRLPQYEWLELQRFAIADDAPKNTASRMMAWMTRDIRRRIPEITRLISYQDTEAHTGCIYRAAGWLPTVLGSGGEWNCESRKRPAAQSAAPKQRWEKAL